MIGISFLDAQIGRILDTLDELKLWDSTTIVLTSDHGMHNGEKGIWEKWTLFDESARVPLLIYHPQILHPGSRYKSPVELVDIYPTVLDLLGAPYDKDKVCHGEDICKPLEGKSLAGIVLGDETLWKINKYYSAKGQRPDSNSKEVAAERQMR